MGIRTHWLTAIILLQLVLFFYTTGLLWAESRIGVIKHMSGRNAVVTLGISDGVTIGLRGEVFREEMVEGQPITSKLAELTVIEAYPDSAVIEIRMRFAPVRQGDQVRVDNVIVPRTIVPEEEKPASVESLVVEQKKPSKKYRIGIGGGPVISFGSFGRDVGHFGYGLNIHLERKITRRFAVDVSYSRIGFPIQEASSGVEPFPNGPVKYSITTIQLAIRLKFIVSQNPIRSYLHVGLCRSGIEVRLIDEDGVFRSPDLHEFDYGNGIQIGGGLDFPISKSFVFGLEIDVHQRGVSNDAIVQSFGWEDGVGLWGVWAQVKYKL